MKVTIKVIGDESGKGPYKKYPVGTIGKYKVLDSGVELVLVAYDHLVSLSNPRRTWSNYNRDYGVFNIQPLPKGTILELMVE